MAARDPRVDAYIARARPFAQPILKQLRATIHAASPKIVETIKWGSPSYEYEGLLCGFAAFKEHCIFGFWKHTLVIPKTPARNVLDASPAQLAACMATVQKVANATMKAFGADGIMLQQFNEPAGGQVVFHLHFHVLPRMEGKSLGPPAAKMEKPEVLAANAEKIRKVLAA